jgi:hypothetical protein
VDLGDETAASMAAAAIQRLVGEHGPGVYSAVAARADGALEAAGDDPAALRDDGDRFPNSEAAKLARVRLLDRSVKQGELGVACDVFAQGLRSGGVAPGILRRTIVAAEVRGNHGLALAMMERLRWFADERSDWPDDGGATYGAVLERLAGRIAPPPAPPALEIPEHEVSMVRVRSRQPHYRTVPLIDGDGFAIPADRPLFVRVDAELVAFDVHASAAETPVLFRRRVTFPEQLIGCGSTIVMADLERVLAFDHRSGEVLWEMPGEGGRTFDGLGTQSGVVHVAAISNAVDGAGELLGIEPLSGRVLFRRGLARHRALLLPRPSDVGLLTLMPNADGGVLVQRVDPVGGETLDATELPAATVRERLRLPPERLTTREVQRAVCADDERFYLPLDRAMPGEPPRVVAIDRSGKVAWVWEGRSGTTLAMAGNRGDRLVVVETDNRLPGRILLLAAGTGEVIRTAELGQEVRLLNWDSSRLPRTAPTLLTLTDRPDPRGPYRFVGFGIDDGQPTFEVRLSADDGEIEPTPLIGRDFVTFGVRPLNQGQYRLYTLRLNDRSGALPSGAKYQRLDMQRTHGVSSVGPYTVVASVDGLMVLGADRGPR